MHEPSASRPGPPTQAPFPPPPPRMAARQRGQSLAEFALVVPILLLLLLTVADFSRLFAAGIAIESAARTSAETAAGEYLRALGNPTDSSLASAADYALVAGHGWRTACNELATLPNLTFTAPGVQCDGLPTVVCVHDNADPGCSIIYNNAGSVPAACMSFVPGSLPTNARPDSGETSRYVEVRLCYRFSTILSIEIPFLGITLSPLGGDFYLERARTFTVADY